MMSHAVQCKQCGEIIRTSSSEYLDFSLDGHAQNCPSIDFVDVDVRYKR